MIGWNEDNMTDKLMLFATSNLPYNCHLLDAFQIQGPIISPELILDNFNLARTKEDNNSVRNNDTPYFKTILTQPGN